MSQVHCGHGGWCCSKRGKRWQKNRWGEVLPDHRHCKHKLEIAMCKYSLTPKSTQFNFSTYIPENKAAKSNSTLKQPQKSAFNINRGLLWLRHHIRCHHGFNLNLILKESLILWPWWNEQKYFLSRLNCNESSMNCHADQVLSIGAGDSWSRSS